MTREVCRVDYAEISLYIFIYPPLSESSKRSERRTWKTFSTICTALFMLFPPITSRHPNWRTKVWKWAILTPEGGMTFILTRLGGSSRKISEVRLIEPGKNSDGDGISNSVKIGEGIFPHLGWVVVSNKNTPRNTRNVQIYVKMCTRCSLCSRRKKKEKKTRTITQC